MSKQADIGVIGLGVMGAALARNFHSRGLVVATWNRETDMAEAFTARHGDDRFVSSPTLGEFVQSLETPRRIIVMVTAGRPVDLVLEALAPHLGADDIVVDGGNTFFRDTVRRDEWCRARGFRFVGMGVSGGEEGALKGPAMMPGGDVEAWQRLRPVLELACARSEHGPCVDHCGAGGAGHYVKMVHTGIEDADRQIISEIWTLLAGGLGVTGKAAADVFAAWNETELRSYLVEVTALVLSVQDPQTGGPLVDQILDAAGQKGTGRWTVEQGLELGIPVPTLAAAVDARGVSSNLAARRHGASIFGARGAAAIAGLEVGDLRKAFYAARLASYSQGFQLLQAASSAHGFGANLAAVSRIWTAGCILRAALLDRLYAALVRDAKLELLHHDPDLAASLAETLPALRKTVARATEAGYAIPCLSSALNWLDGMATARGSAALIQAQRDCFGAHTYKRVDAPDVAVHSLWAEMPKLVA